MPALQQKIAPVLKLKMPRKRSHFFNTQKQHREWDFLLHGSTFLYITAEYISLCGPLKYMLWSAFPGRCSSCLRSLSLPALLLAFTVAPYAIGIRACTAPFGMHQMLAGIGWKTNRFSILRDDSRAMGGMHKKIKAAKQQEKESFVCLLSFTWEVPG